MKLKHLLSVVMLFACMVMQAAITHLIVELNDSKKYSFLLADKPVITFNEGDLVVNGNEATSYAISNVKNYHFGEGTQTSAQSVAANELRISYIDANTVKVQNADANAQVAVISVSGAVVSSQAADAEGVATVQLPSQKGVYIVKVADKSFKVIRK